MYFFNPKAASQSMVLGALSHRIICRSRGFRNWRRVWTQLYELRGLNAVFMFTFVRNPWDRAVSAFNYLQDGGIIKQDSFKDYIKNYLPTARRVLGAERDHFVDQVVPFNGGLLPGLFIGRFENLMEDWDYVRSETRVFGDKIGRLPFMNRRKHKHYIDYYDDESVEIIRKMYHRDIKLLGYEFGK